MYFYIELVKFYIKWEVLGVEIVKTLFKFYIKKLDNFRLKIKKLGLIFSIIFYFDNKLSRKLYKIEVLKWR